MEHTEVFAIKLRRLCRGEQGRRKFQRGLHLQGVADQLARLDESGNPEVYAISDNNKTPWTKRSMGRPGSTWAATPRPSARRWTTPVFVIGRQCRDLLRLQRRLGKGWVSLGGYAKAIYAGLDASGKLEVFVIGGDNAVHVNDPENGKGRSAWAATRRPSAWFTTRSSSSAATMPCTLTTTGPGWVRPWRLRDGHQRLASMRLATRRSSSSAATTPPHVNDPSNGKGWGQLERLRHADRRPAWTRPAIRRSSPSAATTPSPLQGQTEFQVNLKLGLTPCPAV